MVLLHRCPCNLPGYMAFCQDLLARLGLLVFLHLPLVESKYRLVRYLSLLLDNRGLMDPSIGFSRDSGLQRLRSMYFRVPNQTFLSRAVKVFGRSRGHFPSFLPWRLRLNLDVSDIETNDLQSRSSSLVNAISSR